MSAGKRYFLANVVVIDAVYTRRCILSRTIEIAVITSETYVLVDVLMAREKGNTIFHSRGAIRM